MKVLFLDVDGVLNSARWFREHPGALNDLHSLDPAAVKLIREVCERTSAQIVLSSTWRIVPTLVQTLRQHFLNLIIDSTPTLPSNNRGQEIAAWLVDRTDVTKFAIVDDDEDAGDYGLRHHLVRTSWESGLTPQHADRLLRLLGGASYFPVEAQ